MQNTSTISNPAVFSQYVVLSIVIATTEKSNNLTFLCRRVRFGGTTLSGAGGYKINRFTKKRSNRRLTELN